MHAAPTSLRICEGVGGPVGRQSSFSFWGGTGHLKTLFISESAELGQGVECRVRKIQFQVPPPLPTSPVILGELLTLPVPQFCHLSHGGVATAHFPGCLSRGFNEVTFCKGPGTPWRHGAKVRLVTPCHRPLSQITTVRSKPWLQTGSSQPSLTLRYGFVWVTLLFQLI